MDKALQTSLQQGDKFLFADKREILGEVLHNKIIHVGQVFNFVNQLQIECAGSQQRFGIMARDVLN